MFKRALLLSTLVSPSLALAATTNTGPTGLHPLRAPAPPAQPPIVKLRSMLQQVADVRGLTQVNVTDEVAHALAQLQAAHSSSLLRR